MPAVDNPRFVGAWLALLAVDNPRFVGAWLALPAAWLALPAAWPVTPKNRRTLTDGALRRKFW